MRRLALIFIGSLAVGLAVAQVAGAFSTGSVVHVHPGESVVVNKRLRCYIGSTDIVCGGAQASHISADVKSSGEIVVVISADPHGAYPGLYVKRATCTTAGARCHLVYTTPQ